MEMEDNIEFAKWCFTNKKYVYDSGLDVWFHRKRLTQYTWSKIYEIYLEIKNTN